MIVVVDSSVAVQWYLQQPGSSRAHRLVTSGHDLVGPALLGIEVAHVLLRAARDGTLSVRDALQAIAQSLPNVTRLFPINGTTVGALELALQHGGSLYDAVYVDLARSLDAIVATADSGMADTARRARIRVATLASNFAGLPKA